VNGAVVPAAEQSEIRERGGASFGPVTDVMALTEANRAAREAAPAVSVMKRAPYRWGNRPGPRRNLDDAAIPIVSHHHPARVARMDCTPGLRQRN